jgi:hypothetical protein
MSSEEVAQAFVQHFYTSFDANVDSLASLYTDQSMMSFEGQQIQGAQNIITKLKSVGPVKHDVKSTDIQPSVVPNGILIFVTGSIRIGGDNPLHYCEVFQLLASAPGQYQIHNNVFRLNYGL